MFFSKIWLFLLTLAAALALTTALLLPRPSQRAHELGEQQRLAVGCGVVNLLLADNARSRVESVRRLMRAPELAAVLAAASAADTIDARRNAAAREVGNRLMASASAKGSAPDFAMFIDARGRVVGRVGRDDKDYGDVAAGRPLVDDALAGLLRDDLWVVDSTLFLVAAAPVIGGDQLDYVGAVVTGRRVTAELLGAFTAWSRSDKEENQFHIDMAVYLGGELMASTSPAALDSAPMVKAVGEITSKDLSRDCQLNRPIELRAGQTEYTAVAARMPGEAQTRQAYFTVFIRRPAELGLIATVKAIRKSDLSPGSFPWIWVGGGFVLALMLGLGLMVLEADRPLRRLGSDAARLARGDGERLSEEHPGRFGSVARNVNIHIDRVARAAKSAKQDLDQLLGPAPQGSLGTIDLLAGITPSAPAIAAPPPPPPSEFRFSDTGKSASSSRPQMSASSSAPGLPGIGAPAALPGPTATAAEPVRRAPVPRAPTPPPLPVQQPPPLRLEDDLLSAVPPPAAPQASVPVMASRTAPASSPPPPGFDGSSEAYFRNVYAQFIAAKQACGESVVGVTFERFSEKLRKNREELMSRAACRDVTFTVYVKDGKAALKASPVR